MTTRKTTPKADETPRSAWRVVLTFETTGSTDDETDALFCFLQDRLANKRVVGSFRIDGIPDPEVERVS